jgi:hypothetical protein
LVLAVALSVAVAVSVTFVGEAEAQKKKKKLKSFHVTSTVAQSSFDGTVPPRVPLTGSSYTYSDTNEFVSLDSTRIILTIDDGDTGPGEFDENQLTLGLDGIDTGIKLNGFRGGPYGYEHDHRCPQPRRPAPGAAQSEQPTECYRNRCNRTS